MPTPSSFKRPADSPWFRHFPQIAGAVVALFGLLTAVSWYEHWQPVLLLLPDAVPMPFNAALCFLLSGAALLLLPSPKISPWLAGAPVVFALLTLLEYVTGRDFHIDAIFLKPYFETATTYPGWMSPLGAFCFLFTGLGILSAALKNLWPQRLTATGVFASIVVVTALVALFGFAFGIESAYPGAYSSMPMSSAFEFLLLGGGLLFWSWQTSQRENFNFLRWLPLTGALTLVALVVFVAIMNTEDLKRATIARQHTIKTILTAQAFEENLGDLQRDMYRYVAHGDAQALAAVQTSRQLEPQIFNQMVQLTGDNPRQTPQLQCLAAAIKEVFAADEKQITARDHPLSPAAAALDDDESRQKFEVARDRLKAFRQMEENLLDRRTAAEDADQQNATLLLVLGRVMVVLLLVSANILAGRELHRRHQIEQKLRETTTLQNAIFNSANYAVIALDSTGVVRTFNPAAERMLGYAAGEIIGRTTPMLWRDQTEVAAEAKKLSHELGRPFQPGIEVITNRSFHAQAEEYEATFIRKNGRRFPVLISLTALADETGARTGFLEVIADITERRRAEEKIRESEERFRSALDNAPIGMALVSPEGCWLKVNHALCAMLGYSDAELLATDFQHLTHPEDLAADLDLVRQMLAGTIASYQMEKRYFHKHDHVVSVMLNVSLVRDPQQHPLYFISQVENITERKQRETEREKLIGELQQALVEVKTLSGMIPICGWCKNVRSDEGYWQTVEQYVRAHTDATFTHGVCPACTEKFKADIFRAAPPASA